MDLRPEHPDELQLRIIRSQLYIESSHVIRRAVPPFFRTTSHIVRIANDGCLTVLRASGTIEVEAVQPRARAVQHLARVLLVPRLRGVRVVQVEVGGDAVGGNVSVTESEREGAG